MKRLFLIVFLSLCLCAHALTIDALSGAVFSPLDDLGRAGPALAVLGPETLDDGRGDISGITPSGWASVPADVPGGYLFNRCHLVAAMLAKGTDVAENLITGTRQLNVAMLDIETQVAAYIRDAGGHVLYRVTPVYQGNEPICRAVIVRAWSMEDDALRIDATLPNTQQGFDIHYGGDNDANVPDQQCDYILNTSSRRFHRPDCPGAQDIKPKNRQTFSGWRSQLIDMGYRPCGMCNP